jgi:hypothetical protein
MSTTIGRDHVVNLVTGNPHPFAVHFDLVVVAHHAALGRATIHQVAARALAVISFERRVEALMPFIVACPVISFLRPCAYTKKHGERTTEQRDELAPLHRRMSPVLRTERLAHLGGCRRPAALRDFNPAYVSVGFKPGLPPWRAHVRFRRVQTLVREGSPLVKLRNSA